MHLNKGDEVRLIATPSQIGVVIRTNPLGVSEAAVVMWHAGPVYSEGEHVAYFGSNVDLIEVVP